MSIRCPTCAKPIDLDQPIVEGDQLNCSSCGERLQVVSLTPLEVDYVTDEDARESGSGGGQAAGGEDARRRRGGWSGPVTGP